MTNLISFMPEDIVCNSYSSYCTGNTIEIARAASSLLYIETGSTVRNTPTGTVKQLSHDKMMSQLLCSQEQMILQICI